MAGKLLMANSEKPEGPAARLLSTTKRRRIEGLAPWRQSFPESQASAIRLASVRWRLWAAHASLALLRLVPGGDSHPANRGGPVTRGRNFVGPQPSSHRTGKSIVPP